MNPPNLPSSETLVPAGDAGIRMLVLLRHGQSVWNEANLFTGWTDVDLTARGTVEARQAGARLAASGYSFDTCFTSVLKRAIKTLHLAPDEMDLLWLPVQKSWRLNERHYGALQGLNKAETAARHGEQQVFAWRRSWDVPPPPLAVDDKRHPCTDPRYRNVESALLPTTESLSNTVDRVLLYWHDQIAPALRRGDRVLVAAHGNSLRGLVKYLSDVSDQAICNFEMPTGMPLIYMLDEALRPRGRRFLDVT
jgi:2,3-bisphosphoglycerate-dependent phosphoglycerate mutase